MNFVRKFAAFWYDFIVGDDWAVAIGVLILLGAEGVLVHANLQTTAWVVMPVGVIVVLAISLRRAVRTRSDAAPNLH